MMAMWQYFTLDAPTSKIVTCNIYKEIILRGFMSVQHQQLTQVVLPLTTNLLTNFPKIKMVAISFFKSQSIKCHILP